LIVVSIWQPLFEPIYFEAGEKGGKRNRGKDENGIKGRRRYKGKKQWVFFATAFSF